MGLAKSSISVRFFEVQLSMLGTKMRPCTALSCLQVDILVVRPPTYSTLPVWVSTALSVIVTCAYLHKCKPACPPACPQILAALHEVLKLTAPLRGLA